MTLLLLGLLGQMVFQACNHPFVLQMDYAFQTESHAIIVLNLITTGNLQVCMHEPSFRRRGPINHSKPHLCTPPLVLDLFYSLREGPTTIKPF